MEVVIWDEALVVQLFSKNCKVGKKNRLRYVPNRKLWFRILFQNCVAQIHTGPDLLPTFLRSYFFLIQWSNVLVENLYGLANEAIHPFNYFLVHFSIFRTIGSFLKIENAISIWTFEIWKLNCERLITLHNFSQKFFTWNWRHYFPMHNFSEIMK